MERLAFKRKVINQSIIERTYSSENLPPAFAEAASRRQVTPLCQRGVLFLPLEKGGAAVHSHIGGDCVMDWDSGAGRGGGI